MPELSTWPVQNSGPTGTLDSREVATHVGALLAPGVAALKAKSGFRPSGGASPGLVTATGTPDGFVHVAPFNLMLQNVRGSGLGAYVAGLDAVKDINILSTPADPTNPRDDLVIAQQSDIFDADANSDFVVKQVVGTPSGTPADPTVTGSTNYVTLARVRVDANATSIASAKITDLRTSGHAKSLSGGLYAVALGGTLPVASAAERNALTSIYPGFRVYRTDVKIEEIYDGTVWKPAPGTAIGEYIQTTVQTLADNTVTPIQLNGTDILDIYSAHDPVTNNSRFVFPFGGRFHFNGGVGYATHATGVRDALWAKNGAAISGGQAQIASAGSVSTSVTARGITVEGVTGDYVELDGYQNRGGTLDTDVSNSDHSRMSVTYVGG